MTRVLSVAALAPGDKVKVGFQVWEVASISPDRFGVEWLQITWAHGVQSAPMSPYTEFEIAECDGCDQDPWRKPVHYGSCPLTEGGPP